MRDYKILFKLASRQRPEKFRETVVNIINHKYSSNNLILVSADLDDETMYNDKIHKFCNDLSVAVIYGKSSNKVHAINRDLTTVPYDWDILINVSDDQKFTQAAFDNIIRKDMYDNHPDLDGILHYPDSNRRDLMTMSIIGRKYFERTNYIYYPGYNSFRCDDEAMAVAKLLRKYTFIDRSLYTHDHPNYNKAEKDDLYILNEMYERGDEELFQDRAKHNFHINF